MVMRVILAIDPGTTGAMAVFHDDQLQMAQRLPTVSRVVTPQRKDKKTRHISDVAEFWKFMALKKEGTTIKIPKRQFLGLSPEVEKAVTDIIEDNLQEYLGKEMEHFEKRLKK
jgi:hypothetical protein